MTRLSRERLSELATHRHDPSVSILIPTHVGGREIAQDAIRLKNALTSIERQFDRATRRQPDHRRMLDQIRALVDDHRFWQHRTPGTAIFASPHWVGVVDLTSAPRETAIVGDRFHVAPLIPSISRDPIAVLALALGEVRLYRIDEFSITPVSYDGPRSFEEATKYLDREAQLQRHPSTSGPASLHGHDPDEKRDADVTRFVSMVTKSVAAVLSSEPAIVMAANGLRAMAVKCCRRPVIEVEGSPEGLDEWAIHGRLQAALQSHRRSVEAELLERLEAETGRGRVSFGAEATLEAAHAGRVHTLVLTPASQPIWTRYPEVPDAVGVDTHPGPGVIDLRDEILTLVLENGGQVTPLETLPSNEDIGALLRY